MAHTLSDQGRRFTSKIPNQAGTKYAAPTYALELGHRVASRTPVKIVKISITPGTQDKRVVCRAVYPNEATMSDCWFVNELGTLSRAEKRAKSHVLGSVKASIILEKSIWGMKITNWINTYCSILKCLFSTPVWFSYADCKKRGNTDFLFIWHALRRCTAVVRSSGVRNQAFVGESGNKNLRQAGIIRRLRIRNIFFIYSPEWNGKNQRQQTGDDH